ncbi:MAG: hypothetical protein PHS31_11130 [Victivallaceae bacterium]|nr:hypothetical protein [Victivallaceae bacterium]
MSCNHFSDCQRCGRIVEDLEDLVKDLEEEIERLNDDLKAERIALERTVSSIKRSRDEWPLRSRWVPFVERWPEPENTVLAREIGGNTTGAIRYIDNDDGLDEPTWVFNGEYYMRKDDVIGLEWLEVKEKGGE